MKTTSNSIKSTTVTIIARIVFKADYKKVCYLVRSSDGATQYTTCLFEGRATSCTCPSRKPCKHMRAAENAEHARSLRVKAEREQAMLTDTAPCSEDVGCVNDWEQNLYYREQAAQAIAQASAQEQEDAWEQEHAAWCHEQGLDQPMTSADIEQVARYELACIA